MGGWNLSYFNGTKASRGRGETFMQDCSLKVVGCAGGAFLALASGAENLQKFLGLPGGFWIVMGTLIVGWWATLMYCSEESDE